MSSSFLCLYLAFIVSERLFHVSGVVAVLGAGLTLSALGLSRIAPENWAFLSELWEQIAFWARFLIFVLASVLIPRLLADIDARDIGCSYCGRVRRASFCVVRAFAAAPALSTYPAHISLG